MALENRDRRNAALTVAGSRETISALTRDLLNDPNLGIWSFEMDEGKPPRMYGNKAMDALLGCDGAALTPEEYYHAWYDHIDPDHYEEVHATVEKMVSGRLAEVQYPFLHPTRGRMMVRCGGHRDPAYAPGLRIVGRHQDVSELLHFEKRSLKALADERDRLDKERRVTESLELLVAEQDFDAAIEQLIRMWSAELGAQWICFGQFRKPYYHVLNSYVAEGEKVFYTPGADVVYLEDFNRDPAFHGSSDYLPMPDFQTTLAAADFARVATDPEAVRDMASCYSHIVRLDGRPWGSLVIAFRKRRELTPNEERFFASAARAVQTALMRQRFENSLRAERDHAVEAEKAKSVFFSSVSHDIRTPLNAIIGFADLLEKDAAGEEERRRYVSTIRSSGHMLARLVDDVLDLSRLEVGRLDIVREPTDVPAVVREVADAFAVTRSEKAVALDCEIGDMPRMNVDPHRIRQMLFNLLSNAFKYTDRGRVSLRASWRDGALELVVSDTGCGISKEDQARILQPFVQVSDRNHRTGTGLGLPICRKLAKLMNGALKVESEPGKGSTFTIVLKKVETVRSDGGEKGPASNFSAQHSLRSIG